MKWAVATLALLFLADLTCAKGKHCTFRVHTEANANDSAVFARPIVSATGRKLYISKTPLVSEQDVDGFRAYDGGDGSYGVLLQLTQHGRLALDTASVERRGTSLFVFINGRQVTELQIDRRVSDGRIFIERGLTPKEIDLMKKAWDPIKAKKS